MGCESYADCIKSDKVQKAPEQLREAIDQLLKDARPAQDHIEKAGEKGKEALDELGKAGKSAGEAAAEAAKKATEAAKSAADAAKEIKFGNIFDQGLSAVTKVDSLGLAKKLQDNFSTFDKNGDGFISKEELADSKTNLITRVTLAGTISAAEKHFDNLQGLNKDALIWDNNGISRKDLAVLTNIRTNGSSLSETAKGGMSNVFSSDLLQHGSAALAGGAVWKLAANAGTPGRAIGLGLGVFAASEAALGTLKYKMIVAPRAEAIISDLK